MVVGTDNSTFGLWVFDGEPLEAVPYRFRIYKTQKSRFGHPLTPIINKL